MKYVLNDKDVVLRTNATHLKDITNAKKLLKPVNGVKGSTELESLKYFDLVCGFPIEYMHSVILWVVKELWFIWSKLFLNKKQRDLVDDRLAKIKACKEIHRLPTKLKIRKGYKAAEWEFWLTMFSLPRLKGILPEEHFEPYSKFVRSIVILLSDSITEDDLLQCKLDILNFIKHCQTEYGESFMKFNLHIMEHLVENVKRNGPL